MASLEEQIAGEEKLLQELKDNTPEKIAVKKLKKLRARKLKDQIKIVHGKIRANKTHIIEENRRHASIEKELELAQEQLVKFWEERKASVNKLRDYGRASYFLSAELKSLQAPGPKPIMLHSSGGIYEKKKDLSQMIYKDEED